MSEQRSICEQLEDALLDENLQSLAPELREHSATCPDCQVQVAMHQALANSFAGESVPQLSPAFDSGLARKLRTARPAVRSLSGWRLAAMLGYVAAAAALLRWALKDVPVPPIDLSAAWIQIAVFLAVPVTLLLAVAASRWLPSSKPRLGPLALGL